MSDYTKKEAAELLDKGTINGQPASKEALKAIEEYMWTLSKFSRITGDFQNPEQARKALDKQDFREDVLLPGLADAMNTAEKGKKSLEQALKEANEQGQKAVTDLARRYAKHLRSSPKTSKLLDELANQVRKELEATLSRKPTDDEVNEQFNKRVSDALDTRLNTRISDNSSTLDKFGRLGKAMLPKGDFLRGEKRAMDKYEEGIAKKLDELSPMYSVTDEEALKGAIRRSEQAEDSIKDSKKRLFDAPGAPAKEKPDAPQAAKNPVAIARECGETLSQAGVDLMNHFSLSCSTAYGQPHRETRAK